MSEPKLNIKEETSAKKTRSPPKKAKVERTVPKKKKLKTDADKAAEKAQHLRFGKAELTPDELSRLSKAQKHEMYAAHAARSAVHREVDQYEDENVGVQALSEGEKAAETTHDIAKSRYARKLKKKAKIEEDGSVIHIRQAVKVVKGTVSIGSPKSKDSIRDIPVPLNVRPCAIKLRDTTDQFIWESPKTGLPCNPTHFRDVFRKSLEEAGDVRLLTPHSCRHTYVSQMQALGVDIQTIQSIVGHADTEMTEHYLHVQESIRQSAIQLFSEAFSA